MSGNFDDIVSNKMQIEKSLRKAEKAAGRRDGCVRLMAVSKMQPGAALEAALEAGQRLFGENKVQEAIAHWKDRRAVYKDLELHLIGPLQTNKVKEAVSLFNCIQTLDREKLAKALRDEMDRQGRDIPCFIQVNTGEEEQKGGIAPHELMPFHAYCMNDLNLRITGLMCIPPADEPAGLHFALLRKYADRLNLPELSMGMSADYLKSVPLGATCVRVGTAFFGAR